MKTDRKRRSPCNPHKTPWKVYDKSKGNVPVQAMEVVALGGSSSSTAKEEAEDLASPTKKRKLEEAAPPRFGPRPPEGRSSRHGKPRRAGEATEETEKKAEELADKESSSSENESQSDTESTDSSSESAELAPGEQAPNAAASDGAVPAPSAAGGIAPKTVDRSVEFEGRIRAQLLRISDPRERATKAETMKANSTRLRISDPRVHVQFGMNPEKIKVLFENLAKEFAAPTEAVQEAQLAPSMPPDEQRLLEALRLPPRVADISTPAKRRPTVDETPVKKRRTN